MSTVTKAKNPARPLVARRAPAKPAPKANPYGIAHRKLPENCSTVGDFRASGGEIGKRADWNLIAAAHAAREV